MLRIVRTFVDEQGRRSEREEFVRNNDFVIQSYAKIRQTKSEKFMFVWKTFIRTVFSKCSSSFRKAFYALDDDERERLKRERRRLQEQLRRVKRNEIRFDQYEKEEMLFRLQQENLALIQSNRNEFTSNSSTNRFVSSDDQREFFPSYDDLNLSDENDEESSSSMIN